MRVLHGSTDGRGRAAADNKGAADRYDEPACGGARRDCGYDHKDGLQCLFGQQEFGQPDYCQGDLNADDQCYIRQDGDAGGKVASCYREDLTETI